MAELGPGPGSTCARTLWACVFHRTATPRRTPTVRSLGRMGKFMSFLKNGTLGVFLAILIVFPARTGEMRFKLSKERPLGRNRRYGKRHERGKTARARARGKIHRAPIFNTRGKVQ